MLYLGKNLETIVISPENAALSKTIDCIPRKKH